MDQVQLAALVRDISKVAPQVGKEYADQQAAFEAERTAKEKLLTSVIEMAKPGLAAIANDVPSSLVPGVLLRDGKARSGRPLRVYLLTDGELWEEWEVQSEEGTWYETGATRTVRAMAEKYDVAELIPGLHAALMKQVGKRQPSTANAREDAAKVNAILTLLDVAPVDVGNPDDIPF